MQMDAMVRENFNWPSECLSAVSITFDDGLPSQRKLAVPILNRYDLAATFYVNPLGDYVERLAAWQDVYKAGHEIANHTVNHPCSKNFSFVSESKRTALEDMTLADMEGEIMLAGKRLDELFPDQGAVSFAYPCYQPFVGSGESRASYVPLVAKHCVAGRGRGERANDPWHCDLAFVWSFPCERMGAAELVGLVEQCVAERRWTVLTFHGVHEGHLSISDGDFDVLCQHLATHRNRVWTASVAEVATHIRNQRAARQT